MVIRICFSSITLHVLNTDQVTGTTRLYLRPDYMHRYSICFGVSLSLPWLCSVVWKSIGHVQKNTRSHAEAWVGELGMRSVCLVKPTSRCALTNKGSEFAWQIKWATYCQVMWIWQTWKGEGLEATTSASLIFVLYSILTNKPQVLLILWRINPKPTIALACFFLIT